MAAVEDVAVMVPQVLKVQLVHRVHPVLLVVVVVQEAAARVPQVYLVLPVSQVLQV